MPHWAKDGVWVKVKAVGWEPVDTLGRRRGCTDQRGERGFVL